MPLLILTDNFYLHLVFVLEFCPNGDLLETIGQVNETTPIQRQIKSKVLTYLLSLLLLVENSMAG